MIITDSKIPDVKLIQIQKWSDERGFFARIFCRDEFAAQGLLTEYPQANYASNIKRGTVRGLHLQVPPHAEAKVVRCVRGAVFDVAVDMRPDSPTFRQWVGFELSADAYSAVYLPPGFAHGYQTLRDDTDLIYFCSSMYTPGAETGVRYDDPAIGIDWPLAATVVSAKDQGWPPLSPT